MSPIKYHKYPIYLFFLGGLIITPFVILVSGAPITFFRIVIGLVLIGLFTLMGWALAFTSGTIYNRKVDHGVRPEDLVAGHYYWLNGETPVKFDGVHAFTGKLIFCIAGLNNIEDPEDRTLVYPGMITAYFSDRKEV